MNEEQELRLAAFVVDWAALHGRIRQAVERGEALELTPAEVKTLEQAVQALVSRS